MEKGLHHASTLIDPTLAVLGFDDFPMPLAVVGPHDRVEGGNRCFQARFGDVAATLQRDGPQPGPWSGWRPVRLRFDSGSTAQVRGHALELGGKRLVLVDAERDGPGLEELERVRRQVRELERASATDHLTGAWNRSHFDAVMAVEADRCRQTATPLTLVLLDVDHFKAINDSAGHAVGDAVLCALVAVLREHMRASDVLFRWGGEEFVVLAASAGYAAAAVLAEHLRAAVAAHAFAGTGPVTISVGVAEWLPDEPLPEWFQRLDDSLYRAKQAGRNRVDVDRRGLSDFAPRLAGASPLLWHEAFASGNAAIDADHRELVALASELLWRAALPSGETEAGAHTEALLRQVRAHFEREEQLLAAHRYRNLEEHRRTHSGLLRRAAFLMARRAQGQASLAELANFVAYDLVARHMTTVDRAFFPLFAAA